MVIAAQRQITPAQVLLAWGIGCGTAVIPQSVHPDRLARKPDRHPEGISTRTRGISWRLWIGASA